MLYSPPAFSVNDQNALIEAVAAARFATLVSNAEQGPVITHLPLFLAATQGPMGTLIGHVARANPHWKMADQTRPSIAIFHGPDAYVSPNWYPSKAETGKAVPTWNYRVIHAEGTLRIHDDPDWLRVAVSRLTDRHEAGRNDPWRLEDAPEDYIRAQLRGIVGISLEITGLKGKEKLSQNRQEPDRQGVIAGLAGEDDAGSAAICAMMQGKSIKAAGS